MINNSRLLPRTWVQATECASAEITAVSEKEAKEREADWKKKIKAWSADTVKYGSALLKGSQPVATFNTEEMADQCKHR